MRSLSHLESRRWDQFEREFYGHRGDKHNGAFRLKGPAGEKLTCIASRGLGWEHVSISVAGKARCPTWEEMAWVKDQFFASDETVVQFHPPKALYVNTHPYTLHLWRPMDSEIPVPPRELVGF